MTARFLVPMKYEDIRHFYADLKMTAVPYWVGVELTATKTEKGVVAIIDVHRNESIADAIRNVVFGERGFLTARGWRAQEGDWKTQFTVTMHKSERLRFFRDWKATCLPLLPCISMEEGEETADKVRFFVTVQGSKNALESVRTVFFGDEGYLSARGWEVKESTYIVPRASH